MDNPTYSWTFKSIVRFNVKILGSRMTLGSASDQASWQLDRLAYFFPGLMDRGRAHELVMVFAPGGGKSPLRLFADRDDESFATFIKFLQDNHAPADLSALSRDKAFARMKVRDTQKLAFRLVGPLLFAVCAIGFLPILIHGLDGGHEVVSVEAWARGERPSTHNLTLQGVASTNVYKEVFTAKEKSYTKYYIPIVEPNWDSAKPVYFILETGALTDEKLQKILAQKEFEVMVTNVLWERISRNGNRYFTDEGKLKLAPDVVHMERGRSSRAGAVGYFLLLGFVSLVLLIVRIFVAWRSKM